MSEIIDLHHRERLVELAPQIHHDMERSVQQLQAKLPEMVGFVMFAVDKEGNWSTRFSIRNSEIIGRRMLAGAAIEGIRENLVTEKCISERMGWDEQ